VAARITGKSASNRRRMARRLDMDEIIEWKRALSLRIAQSEDWLCRVKPSFVLKQGKDRRRIIWTKMERYETLNLRLLLL
jgi:hypothetical protein